MDLAALTAQFRVDADDEVAPYLASDAKVLAWLDEAQEEAAIRASLIHEATNASICTIAVTAGERNYRVHPSVIVITYAAFTATGSTCPVILEPTDRLELDRVRPEWRTLTDTPRAFIQNDTTLQLDYKPSAAGTLTIECYRTPLYSLDDSDCPEINRMHHRHLVQWALYKCFGRPESDMYDQGRADRALAEFTRVFGNRPDADLRRGFYANRPQHNKAVA